MRGSFFLCLEIMQSDVCSQAQGPVSCAQHNRSFHYRQILHIESDQKLWSFGRKMTPAQNRKSDGDSEVEDMILDIYCMYVLAVFWKLVYITEDKIS